MHKPEYRVALPTAYAHVYTVAGEILLQSVPVHIGGGKTEANEVRGGHRQCSRDVRYRLLYLSASSSVKKAHVKCLGQSAEVLVPVVIEHHHARRRGHGACCSLTGWDGG